MRSGGATINDVPKVHCDGPTVDNHFMLFDQSKLRMTLQLNGVFL